MIFGFLRLYDTVGLYEKAESLYKQSTEIRRTALGEHHPDFAASLNNLAGLYGAMGRYEEAEPLHRQAVDKFRSLLGDSHPSTQTVRKNYELLLQDMGRQPPPPSDND